MQATSLQVPDESHATPCTITGRILELLGFCTGLRLPPAAVFRDTRLYTISFPCLNFVHALYAQCRDAMPYRSHICMHAYIHT